MPNTTGSGKDPTRVAQPRPNQVTTPGWTQDNQPDWGDAEVGDDDPTVIAAPDASVASKSIQNNYKDRPDQAGATGSPRHPEDATRPDHFAKDEFRPGRPSKDRDRT